MKRAVVLVVAVALIWRCGGDRAQLPAPSIVWDRGGYTAAWADARGVHTQRLPDGKPQLIVPGAFRGQPEVIDTYQNALALLTGEEGLAVVQLDAAGRPTSEPHVLPAQGGQFCRAPGWSGSVSLAGYIQDGRFGVVHLADDGSFHSRYSVMPAKGPCAIAIADGVLAVELDTGKSLEISFVEWWDDEPLPEHISIPHGPGGASQLSLVSMQALWAVLYRDAANRMHVAAFSRSGIVADLPLGTDVDPATADLGYRLYELFVTFRRGDEVVFRSVDTSSEVSRATQGDSAPRALGHGSECVAASRRGDGVELLRLPRCWY